MKYMDIKPTANTALGEFYDWMNDMTSKFVSASYVGAKRIEVKTQPEIGELRIKWYSSEALAEENGELVTVEKWDGYGWRQYGLDVHDTVQDLLDLSWKLGG